MEVKTNEPVCYRYSYVKSIQEQGLTLEEAVIKNPTEAAASQDIFVAEFDKTAQTFGEVEQITDDMFCDDFPQAVYDSKTGDYTQSLTLLYI